MTAVSTSRIVFAPSRFDRNPRRVGLLCALGLHAIAVLVLLSYEPARAALLGAAPLVVELIAPERKAAMKPRIEHAKPRPLAKREILRPVEPPPRVTAAAEGPSPIVAAPPPPAPRTAAPEPVVSAPPAPITVPASMPIFDADYLLNPAPTYPTASRRRGEEGRVILRVHVTPAGAADDVQVHSSSGYARLDESARETVGRWKFVPARRGDEKVPAWVLIPISFSLES